MFKDFHYQDSINGDRRLVGFNPSNAIGRTWWKDRVNRDFPIIDGYYIVDRKASRDIITGIKKDLED